MAPRTGNPGVWGTAGKKAPPKKKFPGLGRIAAQYVPGGRYGTNTGRYPVSVINPTQRVDVGGPAPPIQAPGGGPRLLTPGWGSEQDYRNALIGQWDYAAAEAAMRNQDIADEAAVNAAIARGQGENARFMGDLTTALRRANIGDLSVLTARNPAGSGAVASMAGSRQENFQRQSTQAAQQLADSIAEWRGDLAGRKAGRQGRFAETVGDIMARIAQDPRYQPREPVYGEPQAPVVSGGPAVPPSSAGRAPGLPAPPASAYLPGGMYGTNTTRYPVRVIGQRPAPVRYYTRQSQVPLRPGQRLRFAAGRGYYAG